MSTKQLTSTCAQMYAQIYVQAICYYCIYPNTE